MASPVSQSVTQVDAFTNRPFAGNPAAVCVSQTPLAPEIMQQIAAEMNLSETAFVSPLEENSFSLRWFTPAAEIDLCGHATLASAHVLWSEDYLDPATAVRFQTRSGELRATQDEEMIQLDFPSTPVSATEAPATLIEALGSPETAYVGSNGKDYLVEVRSQLETLVPDFEKLAQIPCQGVIVTAPGQPPYDFASRYFAPAIGIPEDPVTGSAHCALGPYWQAKLRREQMLAYQASHRGGIVRVRCTPERIYLGGQAVTVMQGTLRLPRPGQ